MARIDFLRISAALLLTVQIACVQRESLGLAKGDATPAAAEAGTREPASAHPPAIENGIEIVPMSEDAATLEFQKEARQDGYVVFDAEAARREQANEEPEAELRDALFREAGVWPYAQKLDQLDRDFLFLRAREYSPDKFARKYPKIPKAARAKLLKLVRGKSVSV